MSDSTYLRAKELFLAAVEQPASQRSAYLDQACLGDQRLRDEVESLLAHHETRTLLATPALTETLPAAGAALADEPTRSQPGASPARPGVWRGLNRLDPVGWLALGAAAALLTLCLATVGLYVAVQRSVEHALRDRLGTFVDVQSRAVRNWLDSERRQVENWARQSDVAQPIAELAELHRQADRQPADLAAQPAAALRAALRELAGPQVRYLVWSRDGVRIADWTDHGDALGSLVSPTGAALLARVARGESVIRTPYLNDTMTADRPVETGQPTMSVVVPVRHQGQVIAAMVVRGIGTEQEFYDMLTLGQAGLSGETYAVNRAGLLISPSRFDKQLLKLGLATPERKPVGVLEVAVRDPGGNLLEGWKPKLPVGARPLTEAAALGLDRHDGCKVEGYRDYRGVTVVGAWRWLEDPGLALVVEIDRSEALSMLRFLQMGFGVVFALLTLATGAAGTSWLRLRRWQKEQASVRSVGPYLLEGKIGSGGMGEVFRARHALLKRPTAIKFIRPDLATPAMLARFEREVRLAAQLTHPVTIEIYDYGTTEQGTFYCAMELIDGPNLAELVRKTGPLPAPRVVYLLRQICSALVEAHDRGLVHRDIKPQNIMLCERGGQYDCVKLLDFGLARPVVVEGPELTQPSLLAGTPAYMPPEQLRDPRRVDRRGDLYAVGAVAYFLLVGRPAYSAENLAAILNRDPGTPPPRPSEAGIALPPELDELVARLLAADPEARPATADEVLEIMAAWPWAETWGPAEAKAWWAPQSRTGA